MRILFTKGDSVLSKAIRGATGEPVSHVALSFDFGMFDFIVHANLYGLHVESSDSFLRHSEIVYSLDSTEAPIPKDLKNKAKLKALLAKYEFTLYDFGGLLFTGLALLARRYLKFPLPKSNLWQTTGMFECTEWVTEYLESTEDSMITPYKLYLKLKETGAWKDSPTALVNPT